jgi:hypothetical protein
MSATNPMSFSRVGAFTAAVFLALSSCRSVGSEVPAGTPAPPPAVPQETEESPAPTEPVMVPLSETEVQSATNRRVDHDAPNLYRDFEFSVGGVAYGNFDTTVRLNTPYLVGASLDFEDFLGMKGSDSVVRLDANYSFNKRHRVDLGYYDIRRDGSATIGEGIDFGEVEIPAGDVVTKFNTQILKLAYRYNFVTDYRTTLGASLGFHTMKMDLGLKAGQFDIEEEFRVTAPLPLLGLHGAYALSDKWRLRASMEFLQIKLEGFEGVMRDTTLAIDHDTFEHLGWGIGYNGFNLDMEIEKDPLTADIEYAYQGLMVYIRTFF